MCMIKILQVEERKKGTEGITEAMTQNALKINVRQHTTEPRGSQNPQKDK